MNYFYTVYIPVSIQLPCWCCCWWWCCWQALLVQQEETDDDGSADAETTFNGVGGVFADVNVGEDDLLWANSVVELSVLLPVP